MPESNNTVKLKGTPILLDRAIQGLQQTLLANLSWLDKAYGRGYKMVQHLDNGSKYVYPAAYVGGSEYVSLTPNDNIGNFCWFDIYDPQTVASQVPAFPTHTYRGALVFWLNLQTIYESDEFINSEEVKSEILSVITTPGAISSGVGRLAVTEVVEGLDSLYKGYTLEHVYSMRNYAEEDLQSLDKQFFMFPYYGVRFEFEITIREVCPTKKAIVSAPIIKEVTLDENGEYFITADKEGLLLKGVRVDVEVPPPPLEEKQVTITKAKTTEIITPDAEYGLSRVEVTTDIPLESKQITITENGATTIEASEGFEGIESVEITTDVNTLQGLDFEGVFDEEQADEINQFYKDGVEYAKYIKENWSDDVLKSLGRDARLVYMPEVEYPAYWVKNYFFEECVNLQAVDGNIIKFANVYAPFSKCTSLKRVPIIDFALYTSQAIEFMRFCTSLENVVFINTYNTTNLTNIFYFCISLKTIKYEDASKVIAFTRAFSGCYLLENLFLAKWGKADISLADSKKITPESIHYIIQNAMNVADGATARTLTLQAAAKTNWQNSEYYEQDLAVLSTKGITIA